MGNITTDIIIGVVSNTIFKAPQHITKGGKHKYIYLSLYYSNVKGLDKYGIANNVSVFGENDYHIKIHNNTNTIINFYVWSTVSSVPNNVFIFPYLQMLEYVAHIASIRYNLHNKFITVAISDVDYIKLEADKNNYDFEAINNLVNTNDNVIIFNTIDDLKRDYKNILNQHEEHLMLNSNGCVCVNGRQHDKKRRMITALLANMSSIICKYLGLNFQIVNYHVNYLDDSMKGLLFVNTSWPNQSILATTSLTRIVNNIETLNDSINLSSLMSAQYKISVNNIFNGILTKLTEHFNNHVNQAFDSYEKFNMLYKLILATLTDQQIEDIHVNYPVELFVLS